MKFARAKAKNALREAFSRGANTASKHERSARALFAMIAIDDHWDDKASEDARFLSFCAGIRHLCRAQILQDAWVLYESSLKIGGFFVEVGAFDGEIHSNTYLLETRMGWTGILAEPNPELASELKSRRSSIVDSRCVWDRSGESVDLVVTADRELSAVPSTSSSDRHEMTRSETVIATVAVDTVSLTDLLTQHRAPRDIDFMSVDTEGNELRILRAFDFDEHRPRLLAVEHNNRQPEEREIDELLECQGYERRFKQFSAWDGWYRSVR